MSFERALHRLAQDLKTADAGGRWRAFRWSGAFCSIQHALDPDLSVIHVQFLKVSIGSVECGEAAVPPSPSFTVRCGYRYRRGVGVGECGGKWNSGRGADGIEGRDWSIRRASRTAGTVRQAPVNTRSRPPRRPYSTPAGRGEGQPGEKWCVVVVAARGGGGGGGGECTGCSSTPHTLTHSHAAAGRTPSCDQIEGRGE
ncbi:hypothetical protein O3P69_016678 [Scylla paramamosain]|uniref:Uncharacterized protein n=1 Tax=Scylla paramamosain TaxID=85552 RepID=A0AAW0SXR0_SCYPA